MKTFIKMQFNLTQLVPQFNKLSRAPARIAFASQGAGLVKYVKNVQWYTLLVSKVRETNLALLEKLG